MVNIEIVSLLVAIGGLIPLYIDLVLRIRRERRVGLDVEKFPEDSREPVESSWSIRIQSTTKTTEHCTVCYDDKPIPYWDKREPIYTRIVRKGHTANFRIPKQIQSEDAMVTIKDGSKTLWKRWFSEIPIAEH